MRARRDAFTFVELLVVIAIIGILVAVLMPALEGAKVTSRGTASASNLKQLAAANYSYAADHDGVYCPAQDQSNLVRWHGARTALSAPFDPTKGYLSPYLGQEGRVKVCPLFRDLLTGAQSFEDGTGGYGYNAVYIGGTPASLYQPCRVSQVPRPARTVMFTTSAYANGSGVQEYPFCEPPYWPGGNGTLTGSRPSPTVHFRYRGQALVAWCDGHVSAESMQPRDDGYNPHGGDAAAHSLGWFGPDAGNGYWAP